jgi:hypothetical protein
VLVEGAAVALDRLARACDDLRLPLLGQLGIQHEQDFVVGHAPDSSLPSVLGGLTGGRRSGANDAMARQEGGQCSIGFVKARTTWLAALWRRVRRAPEPPAEAEDTRAEELRQKLEESRAVVEEQHEEAASPETPGRRGRPVGGGAPSGRPRARPRGRRRDARLLGLS